MAEIIPAVLPRDYKDLKEKFAVLAGHVPLVHLDVTDATLTKNANWPYANGNGEWEKMKSEDSAFPYWEEFNFEAHLMSKEVEHIYEDWIRAGAERIIVQYEAFDTDAALSAFLVKLQEHFSGANEHLKVEIGLAVNMETSIDKVLNHVLECDFIQLMSIAEIGAQGAVFEEGIFGKIKEVKAVYPEARISIDGGVSMDNVEKLVEAGVERLVVGSAIWKAEDPLEALEDLVLAAE